MTTPISPSGTVPDGSEPNRTDSTDSADSASERSNRRPRGRRHPSRRTALKAAGISGAVLAAGAAGVGIRGTANGAWNASEGAPYELWRQWSAGTSGLRNLVAAATLAANPHNIQPWFFDISGDSGSTEDSTGSIDLRADPDRVTPLCDPDGRERAAGFGCALYAIEVAARAQGKRAEIEPWPDGASERSDHIARIRVVNDAPPTSREQELATAIPRRHTYRGPFTASAPEQAVLDSLTEAAPDGAQLVWVTEASAVARVGDLYVEATQAIADDTRMSADSFAWFRNDRSQIDAHRDGLTLDCPRRPDSRLPGPEQHHAGGGQDPARPVARGLRRLLGQKHSRGPYRHRPYLRDRPGRRR